MNKFVNILKYYYLFSKVDLTETNFVVQERGMIMYYSSGNYEAFAHPKKPEGVDHKSAFFMPRNDVNRPKVVPDGVAFIDLGL